MGREIRMVPANWQHPESEDDYGRMRKQPMHMGNFADAKKEWIEGLLKWETENKSTLEECEYWDYYGNPPEAQYYQPWKSEDATWFQLWETVSEGTPVSPPFATKEELSNYLSVHGDEWDQKRGHGGWGVERAEAFVKAGWAPSMVMIGGQVIDGKLAVLL